MGVEESSVTSLTDEQTQNKKEQEINIEASTAPKSEEVSSNEDINKDGISSKPEEESSVPSLNVEQSKNNKQQETKNEATSHPKSEEVETKEDINEATISSKSEEVEESLVTSLIEEESSVPSFNVEQTKDNKQQDTK